MSLSEVRKPHMKKSVVTIAMALLLVSPGAWVVTEELLTFVIAMPFSDPQLTQSDGACFSAEMQVETRPTLIINGQGNNWRGAK